MMGPMDRKDSAGVPEATSVTMLNTADMLPANALQPVHGTLTHRSVVICPLIFLHLG